MGRNATLHIKNETGYNLNFEKKNAIHGKFNQDPPKSIANGATGTFKVGNNTGALIGPKGTVTYKASIIIKEVLREIYIVIFYDHPFSASTSSYSVSGNAIGLTNFSMHPAKPSGHDQDITLTIRFGDLRNAYDIPNWMSYLNDESSIVDLTIPGTPDSGATQGTAPYKCQAIDLPTQLLTGIRFLDIRLKLMDNKLQVYHGDQNMSLSFEEVQEQCLQYLKDHKNETIIMLVNKEGGDDIGSKFNTDISAEINKWYLKKEIPKLKEVRGKIILMRRFAWDKTLGIDATGWKDNDASFSVDNGNIKVQDQYKVSFTLTGYDSKWKNINDFLNEARETNSDKLYINFTSGSGGVNPNTLAYGADDITPGNAPMNERLYEKISESDRYRYGIIVMDFPEKPHELLIPYLVAMNNFN